MNYPIFITKEPGSDYGVEVPDLPGCVTAGRTMDEAMAMAREAIELHLEGLAEQGSVPPLPRSIEALCTIRQFTGGTWALIHVDPSTLRVRVVRVDGTEAGAGEAGEVDERGCHRVRSSTPNGSPPARP